MCGAGAHRRVVLSSDVKTRYCSIAKVLVDWCRNHEAINNSLLKSKKTSLIINEGEVLQVQQLEPIVKVFADICDAAGVYAVPNISRFAYYLGRLIALSTARASDVSLVLAYKERLRSAIVKVLYRGCCHSCTLDIIVLLYHRSSLP